MRVGAMGATGFDFPALLALADRQGIPEDVMLIILPFADAGLAEAMAERHARHRQELEMRTTPSG